MGAQLQNLYNQGAIQQGNDYNTNLGQYFNQTTPTSPYWGSYTQPINLNPPAPAAVTPTATPTPKTKTTYDAFGGPVTRAETVSNGRVVKEDKNKDEGKAGVLPDYSMYLAPNQMPDVNAYLYSPNSLLGAMQSAGVPMAGAGRFANLLSTNTSTGNK